MNNDIFASSERKESDEMIDPVLLIKSQVKNALNDKLWALQLATTYNMVW